MQRKSMQKNQNKKQISKKPTLERRAARRHMMASRGEPMIRQKRAAKFNAIHLGPIF